MNRFLPYRRSVAEARTHTQIQEELSSIRKGTRIKQYSSGVLGNMECKIVCYL